MALNTWRYVCPRFHPTPCTETIKDHKDTAEPVVVPTVGVIPEALVDKEIAHRSVSDLRIVGSMHERKALMSELPDDFIALPGGLGTAEELFEILTWAQLGLHHRPCGLLNVCSYYDPMVRFLDHSVVEGFVRPVRCAMLMVEQEPQSLIDRFEQYTAPLVDKLLDRDKP